MRVPYAGDTHGLTHGPACDEFERRMREYIGVPYSFLVNSGSSAMLLAIMALTSPSLGDRQLRHGDEVITTALCFPTTITGILLAGAVPVFVDVDFSTLNATYEAINAAVTPKTKAIVLAHTLGNPFDVSTIVACAIYHNLWLVEDNCDALGSLCDDRRTGCFGDISALSFYPAHHISTGEGGMVLTTDHRLAPVVDSMRGWGRACRCPPNKENVCGHRYDGQYGTLPEGYDHKYVYSHIGFNLKAVESVGQLGNGEMDRLGEYVRRRRENWDYLDRYVFGQKQVATSHTTPSWFAFALSVPDRLKVVTELNRVGIQTRPPFAGNITRQPCMEGRTYRAFDLPNTDRVCEETFFVGAHPSLTDEQLDFLATNLRRVL